MTGSTKLLYKGTDGTSRAIDPDNYALKSDVGDYSEMNNELVKHGKEVISEAITDKGITTSSSDSFDDMATNIRNINTSASGTVGEMNIYCQTTKPTAQNGLWIKKNRSDISNILIKENYYLEDGVAGDLPLNFVYNRHGGQNCITGGIYNNILYILYGRSDGTVSSSTYPMHKVNLNDNTTSEFTINNLGGYLPLNDNCTFVYDDILCYSRKDSDSVAGIKLSDLTSKGTIFRTTSSGTSYNICSLLYGRSVYVLNYSGTQAPLTIRMTKFDLDNSATTYATVLGTLTTSNTNILSVMGGNFTNRWKTVYYDNKLYIFLNTILILTFDLSNNTFTLVDYNILPVGYSTSQKPACIGVLSGKVYFIGLYRSDASDRLTDTVIYDIPSNTSIAVKNNISNSDDFPYPYNTIYGSCQNNNNIYILGANHTATAGSSGSGQSMVTKYTIQSNDYDTGTIICQPTATGDHITNMYSSDLVTLNYGIDAVYYQDADGFKKQDAAIIKDGVVTDL